MDKDDFRSKTIQLSGPLAEPIGTITVHEGAGPWGEDLLGGLMVDSAERRKGHGGELICKAEQHVLSRGRTRVFAVTHPGNTAMRAFMKALGYTEMVLWDRNVLWDRRL